MDKIFFNELLPHIVWLGSLKCFIQSPHPWLTWILHLWSRWCVHPIPTFWCHIILKMRVPTLAVITTIYGWGHNIWEKESFQTNPLVFLQTVKEIWQSSKTSEKPLNQRKPNPCKWGHHEIVQPKKLLQYELGNHMDWTAKKTSTFSLLFMFFGIYSLTMFWKNRDISLWKLCFWIKIALIQ